MADYNGPLEAVDFYMHSVGYDMLLERVLACAQIGPHKVTYEAVAPLIADYNGPLEAFDYQFQSDRYDMELHVCWRSCHI
eukprot:scaffold9613_cov72-Skeletonema_dohrnii-CCMP3373.AAC.1